MSIALRVTRGYGNGTVDGSVHDRVLRGYSSGVVEVVGNGTVVADNSVLTGTAVRTIIGNAVVTSDNSVLSGIGGVGSLVYGSGSVVADNSVLSGSAKRVHHADGTIASTSTLDGLGSRIVVGVGTAYPNNSTLSGVGRTVVTASGSVVADDSIVTIIEDAEMPKIVIDPINNSYGSTVKINSNLALIEEELNNKVLYRDNPDGESNQMESNLDMNQQRVYGLPFAVNGTEAVSLLQMQEFLTEGTVTSTEPVVPVNTIEERDALDTDVITLCTVAGVYYKWSGSSWLEGDVPIANTSLYFSTVNDLVSSTNTYLDVNQKVTTKGFLTSGDGGGSDYIIESGDTSNGIDRLLLTTGDTAVRFGLNKIITNTYSVGSGGDFSTINEALASLSYLKSVYQVNQAVVTLNLLTGFVMDEQVLCDGVDLGWIQITSDDATVTITGSSMDTETLVFDGIVHRYAFGATNRGVLPKIETLFVVDNTGSGTNRSGIAINNGSSGYVGAGMGIQSSPDNGITIENSYLFARSGDFSGSGAYGAYLYGGAELNSDMIDLSGCEDGIIATRTSRASIIDSDVSGCTINGLLATQGAVVNAGGINADNCGSAGIRARGAAVINATSCTAKNCQDGVYADRSSRIEITKDTTSSDFTGCSRYALYARNGATISGVDVVCGAGRVFAELGGTINAEGITVANTLTGGHAISTATGGRVIADNGSISTTATSSRAINADSGFVSANGATISGTQGGVIYSSDCGEVVADAATITVTTGPALFALGGDIKARSATFNQIHATTGELIFDSLYGGNIDCANASITWTGTTPATAFRVKDGTIMNISAIAGGANVTANTITADGIVIQ